MGSIYKICNDINNKIYVGETLQSLEIRYKAHISTAKRYAAGLVKEESKLYKAMNKYGIEHFWIELIEEYPDANDRNKLGLYEQFWIAKLDTVNNGYNIAPGGQGGPLFVGHKHSEESKNLMSEHNKWKILGTSNRAGCTISKAQYQALREGFEKIDHNAASKKAREKRRENGTESTKKKAVMNKTTKQIFYSINSASNIYGRYNVRHSLDTGKVDSNGNEWVYIDGQISK